MVEKHLKTHRFDARKPLFKHNETEANKQLCIVCGASGFAVIVALIFYILHLFPLHNYVPVYIAFPIIAAVLFATAFLRSTKLVQTPGFKYYLLYLLLFVIGILNILLPKHGIIAWCLVVILSAHFYNPRLGKIIFVSTLVWMMVCLYVGMFLGEYDNNLLTAGRVIYDETQGAYIIDEPESPRERWDFLIELKESGENRFTKVLAYYYFARALLLTLCFFATNALNVRTKKLLVSEETATRDKARMDTELSVAEEIQRTVLPTPLYQTKQIDLLAQLNPAKEVGGDFYDYKFLDEDHLILLIGDVSGKGVPAAMFMMKTITSFRAGYSRDASPKEVMEKVNKLLYDGNESSMFVTCFFGILDLKSGELRFANAGHTPPVIKRKNGKFTFLPCAKGFILGTLPEAHVEDQTIKLREGDAMLLYTDGITEAKNRKGAFYGEKRLLDFLNGAGAKAVSTIEFSHELEDSVAEFAAGEEQSDDITYLYFFFRSERVIFRQKSFPAVLSEGENVRKFISERAADAHIKGTILNNFLICVDEIFSNIVKYGNVPADQPVYIRCLYQIEKEIASITIVDKGVAFDPRSVVALRVNEREEGAPVGGLGWLMVQHLMDEVSYHRINGKNVVSITKKLK